MASWLSKEGAAAFTLYCVFVTLAIVAYQKNSKSFTRDPLSPTWYYVLIVFTILSATPWALLTLMSLPSASPALFFI